MRFANDMCIEEKNVKEYEVDVMEYTEGYLAFLDILGFSKFVEDEKNGQATADLFKFVEWFRDYFNKDIKHKVKF
jgi:hypothetical protein